jgi:cell division septum initiation protein DivIVA
MDQQTQQQDVMELVDMLYSMINEAWSVPLGKDKCMIERDAVLNILDEIKAQLPVEIAEAKRLVAARDEYISSARREAEAMKRGAEEKARMLIDEQEIVRAAKARSNELLTTAETKSRELRRVANEYVDDAMRRTEEAVAAALDEIRQSRQRFRSASGVQANPQAQPVVPED